MLNQTLVVLFSYLLKFGANYPMLLSPYLKTT